MKRIALNALGFLSLAIGAVGVFVPVLPTTPFVICAAGCFSGANPAVYKKLASSKYFGEYVRNYKEKTGVSAAARARGLIFLWVTLGVSAAIFRYPALWAILGVVGIAVSIHILTIRRCHGARSKPRRAARK
jgi:uncharacterized membrane protein YbaN (DUF454 family)